MPTHSGSRRGVRSRRDARATLVALAPTAQGRLRPARELLGGLSEESRWLRFFSAGVDPNTMARWAATSGSGHGYGVVATAGTPERIVGHAAYVVTATYRALAAGIVSDRSTVAGPARLTIDAGRVVRFLARAGTGRVRLPRPPAAGDHRLTMTIENGSRLTLPRADSSGAAFGCPLGGG